MRWIYTCAEPMFAHLIIAMLCIHTVLCTYGDGRIRILFGDGRVQTIYSAMEITIMKGERCLKW